MSDLQVLIARFRRRYEIFGCRLVCMLALEAQEQQRSTYAKRMEVLDLFVDS